MPCRRGRKTESIFHNVKRKIEQEEKKKKIRTKTERGKERKLRKKEES